MHLRTLPLVAIAALLLLLASALPSAKALLVTVNPGEMLEIGEVVNAQSTLTFQFVVPDEEVMTVTLKDERNRVLKEWIQKGDGVFTVGDTKSRKVTAVFSNIESTFSTKKVNFFFKQHIDHNHAADVKQLDPIEQKISVLTGHMQRLQTLQVKLRTQQKDHRSTVEDANERVLMWSVFQVVALLAMSGFQLYFLKRFLEKKTFL